MNKHFRVPARMVTKLEEHGISPAAVLRRAGLAQDLFRHSRILVSTSEFFALWHAIAAESKDPAIGLKLGTEDRADRFHPSGLAALSTENFGAAISHLARYKQLTCPEEIHQHFEAGEWRISFRWLLAVESEPQVLVDMCFAWLLCIGQVGSGARIRPLRIELVQPREHLRSIERHFGCNITTNAAENTIVFRAEDAQRAFITRNAELLDMLAPQFDNELKEAQQDSTFTELVRSAIQQRLTGHRPSMDHIARDLHLSSRTLQRRLQEQGSSFQRLLDEARHQMARYYLGNSMLELNEAAYLLGYEDSNSFVRAFRMWEGVPPGAWRETHRPAACTVS